MKMVNGTNKNIRVLITGVGHPVALSALESLRRIREKKFYIVGVDLKERGRGFSWVDKHYIIPPATSQEYLHVIVDICRKECIDVVIPWSDDEVEKISCAIPAFEEIGVATLCSSFQSIQRTVDKGTMLQELSRTDIPIPRFELASLPDDIERAAKSLGYPDELIVVKPRRSTCGRGLWILDSKLDLTEYYPHPKLNLSAFQSLLNECRVRGIKTPDYVLMQHLKGDDYSVDVLADSGEPVFMIPRLRLKAVDGVSQICEVIPKMDVCKMVDRIVREFNLHLNVNVQLRYTSKGGHPLVYEINPRISGTIVANYYAGVNLLYYGILLALGDVIPYQNSLQIRKTRIIRYWTEKCIHVDEWFSPCRQSQRADKSFIYQDKEKFLIKDNSL